MTNKRILQLIFVSCFLLLGVFLIGGKVIAGQSPGDSCQKDSDCTTGVCAPNGTCSGSEADCLGASISISLNPLQDRNGNDITQETCNSTGALYVSGEINTSACSNAIDQYEVQPLTVASSAGGCFTLDGSTASSSGSCTSQDFPVPVDGTADFGGWITGMGGSVGNATIYATIPIEFCLKNIVDKSGNKICCTVNPVATEPFTISGCQCPSGYISQDGMCIKSTFGQSIFSCPNDYISKDGMCIKSTKSYSALSASCPDGSYTSQDGICIKTGYTKSIFGCPNGYITQDGICLKNTMISSIPVCGDGVVNQLSEQCDAGTGVSGTPSDVSACTSHQTCDTDCQCQDAPYCGDGIINGTEKCDAGQDVNGTPSDISGCTIDAPVCDDNCECQPLASDNCSASVSSAPIGTQITWAATPVEYGYGGPYEYDWYDSDGNSFSDQSGSCMVSYGTSGIKNMQVNVVDWSDPNGPYPYQYANCQVNILPANTCGDDKKNGTEQCDGKDDSACPGSCIAAGQLNQCTCPPPSVDPLAPFENDCYDGNPPYPHVNLSWNYNYGNGSESKEEIQISSDSHFSSKAVDWTYTSGTSSYSAPISTISDSTTIKTSGSSYSNNLLYGTPYYWRVMVWDSTGVHSSGSDNGWTRGTPFTTVAHPAPTVGIKFIPPTALIKQCVSFTAAEPNCFGTPSYTWTFNDYSTSTNPSPACRTFASAGIYQETLKICDSSDPQECCQVTQPLTIKNPLNLPTWKEISPF